MRTELEQLKMENERLYSHHSECKEEMGRLVELANKWRIRSYVAERLAKYLNETCKFWRPEDLEEEFRIHADRFFEKWKRREPWQEEDEKLWNRATAVGDR